MTGIEPVPPRWQRGARPSSCTCGSGPALAVAGRVTALWSRRARVGLASALDRRRLRAERATGLEPAWPGWKPGCSPGATPAWSWLRESNPPALHTKQRCSPERTSMVDPPGIAPGASACNTAAQSSARARSGAGRSRTGICVQPARHLPVGTTAPKRHGVPATSYAAAGTRCFL